VCTNESACDHDQSPLVSDTIDDRMAHQVSSAGAASLESLDSKCFSDVTDLRSLQDGRPDLETQSASDVGSHSVFSRICLARCRDGNPDWSRGAIMRRVVTLSIAIVSALVGGAAFQEAGGRTSVGLKPLTELSATDKYKGEDGGLYGGGMNTPPPAHLAAAKAAIARIRPLNADGTPADDGAIGFVSISMSNATQEFSVFKELADRDARKSPRVVIVDCAQGGQAMAQWARPDAKAWAEADRRLAAAAVDARQVQVAWVKLANVLPSGALAEHGRKLYTDTLTVLQLAKKRYPNLRIASLGSRIYAGYASTPLNPEPYAYEGAFAVRWLIQDQVKAMASLRYDEAAGAAQVPLLLWGPYLWADGTTPRKADGLTWQRDDLASDGTHPSERGRRKVANMLLDFFTTDTLAKSWFTKP
jgi:lysophospholipase L1-like esterase